MPTRSAPPRSSAPRRRWQLLDPAKARRRRRRRADQRQAVRRRGSARRDPVRRKVELCQAIDAAARARDPRVAQVSVSLAGSWRVVEIVRADGFVATDIRPLVRLNVSIVAEANGRRETG